MDDLVERARLFAGAAHRDVGQLRKYSGQPYEEHLRRVADIVAGVTTDPETVAAAWLHDVVEDTPVTIEEIERAFGPGVRELVDAVTDVSRPHHGNRAVRKALDREHLARAPARAQTVKLADLIDNCQDICRHSPRFGRVFLDEMAALLDVLTSGDEKLRRRAQKSLEKWTARLGPRHERASVATASAPSTIPWPRLRRAARIFARAFRAADVAEALPVFPRECSVAEALASAGVPVFGVRERTDVTAYVPRDELSTGRLGDAARAVVPSQWVDANAGLADVVLALTRHEFCFLMTPDGAAYVGRDEVQGPIARMWLFGIVTSYELAMTEAIRSIGEATDWTELLGPARLAKARELQDARSALGRSVPLVDCLQFSDKIRIVVTVEDEPFPLLRGNSRAESQRLARDLENLRNSLAHAQDVVTHDWAQIARLAKRIEELAAE